MQCPRCQAENRAWCCFCGVTGRRWLCPARPAASRTSPRKNSAAAVTPLTAPRPPEPPARTPSPTRQASGREDPHREERPRRRAQAGHRPLRRPQGLDGAARRPRPRGGAQAPRPGPRADDGGRPPLRGHGQPGDGRRHHGAVRRAARPRGSRRARLLRRPAHAGGGEAVRRGGAPRARASTSRSASASTPARWWCAPSAATCTWTTRRSARPPTWPRAWSSSPRPGSILLTAETLRLAEGFVQVTPLGPVPVKGLAEPVEVYELVGRHVAPATLAGRRGTWVGSPAETNPRFVTAYPA